MDIDHVSIHCDRFNQIFTEPWPLTSAVPREIVQYSAGLRQTLILTQSNSVIYSFYTNRSAAQSYGHELKVDHVFFQFRDIVKLSL